MSIYSTLYELIRFIIELGVRTSVIFVHDTCFSLKEERKCPFPKIWRIAR